MTLQHSPASTTTVLAVDPEPAPILGEEEFQPPCLLVAVVFVAIVVLVLLVRRLGRGED